MVELRRRLSAPLLKRLSLAAAGILLSAASLPAEMLLSNPTGTIIYQRDSNNVASVTVAGNETAGVTTIQARAVAKADGQGTTTDWQTLSVAGSAFNGSLTVPIGWYDIEVRSLNGSSVVSTKSVSGVGVGEMFITAGQSNSAFNYETKLKAKDPRVLIASYKTDVPAWYPALDTYQFFLEYQGGRGSPWPGVGDNLVKGYTVGDRTVEGLNMPVGYMVVGVNGSALKTWLPGGPTPIPPYTGPPNYCFDRLQKAIDFLAPTGFGAILWHQGETDRFSNRVADYASDLEQLIQETRDYADFDMPWFVSLATYEYPDKYRDPESLDYNPAYDTIDEALQAQQQWVIDNVDNVYAGPNTDVLGPEYRRDSAHFNSAGQQEVILLWSDALRAVIQPVPEPSTLALMVIGGAGIAMAGRRRRVAKGR